MSTKSEIEVTGMNDDELVEGAKERQRTCSPNWKNTLIGFENFQTAVNRRGFPCSLHAMTSLN